MKKYFTNYISTGKEIENDSWVKSPNDGVVWQLNGTKEAVIFAVESMQIPVKLCLCSTDIQVGDNVQNNQGAIIPWTNEMEKLFIQGSLLKDGLFKVIGEISPDTLGYVKEGMELNEEDVFFLLEGDDNHIKLAYIKGPCGHFH